MDLRTHKQKLFKTSSSFRKEYFTYDLAFEVGQMIIEARSKYNITQAQLARMINTKQSGIARAESGNYLPSLSFLNKIAVALKTKLIIKFGFMTSLSSESQNLSSNRNYTFEGLKKTKNQEKYLPSFSVANKKDTENKDFNLCQI